MKTVTFDDREWKLVPVEATEPMLTAILENRMADFFYYGDTSKREKEEAAGETYAAILAASPSPPVEQAARGGVDGGAWTESDMERPWGAESAFLRHLADDPALNLEQSAMLRHCAKRIESTAGIHLRALADMLNPAKQAGVLREAADALPFSGERHG